MTKKALAFLVASVALVFVHLAQAQQPKKIPRLGFLVGGSLSSSTQNIEAFRQGLRELGYVEDQNIVIDYRFAEGKLDRLPELAAELLRLRVDVIVTAGSNPARAAQKATTTIPIVMANAADPIADGFVASLARPGGNMTGLSRMAPDLSGKRLALLKETVPKASRVAVLWHPSTGGQPRSKEIEAVARALGMTFQSLQVQTPNDFDGVFQAAKRERADVLFIISNGFTNSHRKPIVELAAKNRLPAMCEEREFVEAGGLMSYGPYNRDLYRRAATYVDKILKGTKPADIPVEQPMKFEFVINLKTAKQIGLTIPHEVLARADKVIK